MEESSVIHASSPQSPAEAAVKAFRSRYPEAKIFIVGPELACTVLMLAEARCHIVYIGEALPEQKIEALAQARAEGVESIGAAVLFDFTRYTGMLDWQYIIRQANVTPGMEPPPQKAAYLWSDRLGEMLVKGISHFVQGTECRSFTATGSALAWLGWE